MTYAGVRAGSPEVLARLAKGAPVDPTEYYFRINPLFDTGDAKYAWLNRVVALGAGHRLPDGPVYSVFEVLQGLEEGSAICFRADDGDREPEPPSLVV